MRINSRIRIAEVRVVDADGELIGVMPTQEALSLARERDLDLVEVAPKSRPPVCRIMDYGKYKYESSKRAKKAKTRQHQIQMKEMRMRPKIEGHDYEFKAKKIREFLDARDKVRVTVMFRGREMTHPERGERILKRLIEDMDDVGAPEGSIRREGRNMVMMLIPKPASGGKKPARPESKAPAGPKTGAEPPKKAGGQKPVQPESKAPEGPTTGAESPKQEKT